MDYSHVEYLKKSVGEAVARADWTFHPGWPDRLDWLRYYQIDKVLDVGANIGQFGQKLRQLGYGGVIHSFEPMSREFSGLTQAAASDPNWHCHPFALGSRQKTKIIHIAANSYSSSFLPMLDRHVRSAPGSHYIGTEFVAVKRLDSIAPQLLDPQDRVYMKIDVQGFEREVLRGARKTLKQVSVLETELSIVPLYEHGALLPDMLKALRRLGFAIAGFDHDFVDPGTGEVLQINRIFVRS